MTCTYLLDIVRTRLSIQSASFDSLKKKNGERLPRMYVNYIENYISKASTHEPFAPAAPATLPIDSWGDVEVNTAEEFSRPPPPRSVPSSEHVIDRYVEYMTILPLRFNFDSVARSVFHFQHQSFALNSSRLLPPHHPATLNA